MCCIRFFLSEKVHLWIVNAHSPENKFFSPEKKGIYNKIFHFLPGGNPLKPASGPEKKQINLFSPLKWALPGAVLE